MPGRPSHAKGNRAQGLSQVPAHRRAGSSSRGSIFSPLPKSLADKASRAARQAPGAVMQLSELRGHKQYADRAFQRARDFASAGCGPARARHDRDHDDPAGVAGARHRVLLVDPMVGRRQHLGALPFIWGTLYTAVIAIRDRGCRSASASRCSVTQNRAGLAQEADGLPDGPARGGCRRWCSGCGGVLVLSQHFGLGRSFLTAGIILAIMITPIITSLAREVIETHPRRRTRKPPSRSARPSGR